MTVYDPIPEWAALVQDEIPTEDEIVVLRAQKEAQRGEVVVTKNEHGQIVAVTRQDEEGRILKVIAETTTNVPQRMFIPEIGTRITLAADWEFNLYDEYRNDGTAQFFGLKNARSRHPHTGGFWPTRLTKGTQLSVDRVYIRRGNSEFSSITFNIIGLKKPIGSGLPSRVRFWAKLEDVNRIVFNPTPEWKQTEM